MNLYGNYKSPLGYQTGENQIDTYGVDHSGFSTRDELEYQFARQNKENQLIQNYNNQGITKNYPQQGTNFWGGSDNNYGFGSSNIHDNIENRNNNPFENTVNTFGQNQTEQSYGLGNSNQNQNLSWPQSYGLGSENQTFGQENNNSTQWGLNNTPLAQNNNNNTLSGNLFGKNNLFNQNQSVWNKNQYQTPTPWAKQSTSFGNNYRNMFVQELYPIQRCALEAENQQFLNPSLSFDGKELAILDNGNLVKSWKALSGRRKMQCKTNTDKISGPIPEGQWLVKQSNLQEYKDLPISDKFLSNVTDLLKAATDNGPHVGAWSGGRSSWGPARIWLEPVQGTNTLDRTGITIHGGDSYGSAGCIDLAPNMDNFVKYFKQTRQDLPLEVKYNQDCWTDYWKK